MAIWSFCHFSAQNKNAFSRPFYSNSKEDHTDLIQFPVSTPWIDSISWKISMWPQWRLELWMLKYGIKCVFSHVWGSITRSLKIFGDKFLLHVQEQLKQIWFHLVWAFFYLRVGLYAHLNRVHFWISSMFASLSQKARTFLGKRKKCFCKTLQCIFRNKRQTHVIFTLRRENLLQKFKNATQLLLKVLCSKFA